jgi:broad specificity phosphatase PhoE
MKTTIYLVRHGQSELNAKSILAGHVDAPLTELGVEQAHQAKDNLKNIKFDAAYSSDLQRAVITGGIVYGKPIPGSKRLKALRERTYGSLDGKPDALRKEGDEKMKAMSAEERWSYKHVHDMESDGELSARFLGALETIAKDNYGKTVLIANHGGTIRTTLMKLLNFSHAELPPGSFKNAGYIVLEYSDSEGFKVANINGAKPK